MRQGENTTMRDLSKVRLSVRKLFGVMFEIAHKIYEFQVFLLKTHCSSQHRLSYDEALVGYIVGQLTILRRSILLQWT